MSARSSVYEKRISSSPNLCNLARAEISCQFLKTRSFCRTVYNMNGLYPFFFNSRSYIFRLSNCMYLTIYEVIYVSEMQETKRWHFSKTDNFYAYCYVYLLWHHLTSVIKRLQLKRGPIWCIYLLFCFKLPFEILSRYDLCDITAESFFFFFLYWKR